MSRKAQVAAHGCTPQAHTLGTRTRVCDCTHTHSPHSVNSLHPPLRGPWPPLCSPLQLCRVGAQPKTSTPSSLCLYSPTPPGILLRDQPHLQYFWKGLISRLSAKERVLTVSSASFLSLHGLPIALLNKDHSPNHGHNSPYLRPLKPSCIQSPSGPMAPDRPGSSWAWAWAWDGGLRVIREHTELREAAT